MSMILNYPIERARAQYRADEPNRLRAHPFRALQLPASVDLRPQDSAIYDQGQLGSCTANAVGGLAEFLQRKEGISAWVPSRLFIYYQERVDMGTVGQDSGATIAESIQACVNYGFPPETDWPYNIQVFTQKPPPQAYMDAAANKITAFTSVSQDVTSIKSVLAAGYPVDFGFVVYGGYESVGPDGMIPMPSGQALGGHANLLIGYDDTKQCFLTRNSWGTGWGMSGYGWFPYAYMTDARNVSDLWTASKVSPDGPPPPPPPPPGPHTASMKVAVQPSNAVVGTPANAFSVALLLADGNVNTADNSTQVTAQLANFTVPAPQKVTAVNGVCIFHGDTFQNAHQGANALHYVFTAAGLFSVLSATFEVAPSTPPPPPPPGPLVKTHQLDVYSDGTVKLI